MGNRHVYIIAALLTAGGLGLFLYKALVLAFPILPGEKSDLWDIEVQVNFTAHNKPAKVSLFIPRTSSRFAVLNENFISRGGYGLTTSLVDGNRQAVWAIRRAAGPQVLYYRAMIQDLKAAIQEFPASQPEIEIPSSLQGPYLAAAEALLVQVREQSADLDTLVAQLIQRLDKPKTDNNVALLVGSNGSRLKKLETAIQVLALAHIPARLLRGIHLELQRGEVDMVPWLQVYAEGKWNSYDPRTGEAGLPQDYLIFWRGSEPFLKVKGGDNQSLTVTVNRTEAGGIEAATVRGRVMNPHLLEFSLFNLPIKTQEVYRVLLVVPMGVVLLVIMRNMVGVKTFGTFMPVLIALAFRETELLWGIVLFTVLVILGLSIRFYLERLKLLLVPRLAAVLMVVIFLMALVSVLSNHLGLERGLSVALFPMVIITMTIERMSIVWEEHGPARAFQEGAGSLATAALAYALMSLHSIEHLMFVFPELLLVLLGITLLLGRYRGYRLLELRRFRAVAGGSRP
jgi:hypothetical protein